MCQEANEQYVLNPSDDETRNVIRIMQEFESALLDPSAQEHLTEFHLGCAKDRIAWDDREYDITAEGSPLMMVSVDVEEMSEGRFDQITPEGLQKLLFHGPHGKEGAMSLLTALLWERDRLANGEAPGVHYACIYDQLNLARDAMLANCKAAPIK